MTNLTKDEAAHLLRRAGFGGSFDEIDGLMSRSREEAVDYLINYTQIDNREMDDLLKVSFDFSDPADFAKFNLSELERWWFTRMIYTRRQFEEKMTLFWHNHFATSAAKVTDIFMYLQNRTLRRHALDRFDTLLLRIAQDPAMLIWLDGTDNVRDHPNENFARELQELFTMGIFDVVTGEPNYTEEDVKEIARAFTGWTFFHPPQDPDPFSFTFAEHPPAHDDQIKIVYGKPANYDGRDIIDIISARPATARYLTWKLFNFFVYPLTGSSEDRATIEKFANIYLSKNHSIKEMVRAIFISDEFFSPRARFALVKSPIELIVGSIRMLGARYIPGKRANQENANILSIISIILGQEPFAPPDVAGWKLNLGWINTSTLLNRFTYAELLATARNPNAAGLAFAHEQVKTLTRKTAKKTIKKLLSTLGPLNVDSETVSALKRYLETDDQGNRIGFSADDLTIDKKMRGLIRLIMCLSEYQLN